MGTKQASMDSVIRTLCDLNVKHVVDDTCTDVNTFKYPDAESVFVLYSNS